MDDNFYNSQAEEASSELDEEEEELRDEIKEARNIVKEGFSADTDQVESMRVYLLSYAGDKRLNFDYKNDQLLTTIMKMPAKTIYATYNYIRAQIKKRQDRGLTGILVDNFANVVMYIADNEKAGQMVRENEELREAAHDTFGSMGILPASWNLLILSAHHLMDAFYRRWSGTVSSNNRSLPQASVPSTGLRP